VEELLGPEECVVSRVSEGKQNGKLKGSYGSKGERKGIWQVLVGVRGLPTAVGEEREREWGP